MRPSQTDSPDALSALRILIVDDDVELCELVGQYLKSQGFQIEAVHDGSLGLERSVSGAYSLIILDVMLPGIRGFEVLRRVRAKSAVPIIMLTARIHAVLRRTVAGPPADTLGPVSILLDDIRLDTRARAARHKARDVELTSAEFELLALFFRSPGQVISRDDLVRGALGRDAEPSDRSLDVHISNLRKKLGTCPDGAERIRAIRNVGYVYVVSGAAR